MVVRNRLLLSFIVMVGASVLPLIVLEVVLWVLPVSSSTGALVLDEKNPVMRYTPNQEYVFSKGWNFAIVNKGRINNYGFVNDHDYTRHASNGPIVVIGDSYVEAMMVPYKQTIQGRLAEILPGDRQVYSVGVSGAQLADYLEFARYSREEFHPNVIVFVIVGNDFDESLTRYSSTPGYHFEPLGKVSEFRITRTDYHPSKWKSVVRHSALVRYLWKTIGIGNLYDVVSAQWGASREYAGNTDASVSSERLLYSQAAVDFFLQQLPQHAGLAPSRIVFVVDGVRPELYAFSETDQQKPTYFQIMRQYFIEQAMSLGYEAIDMQTRFRTRHRLDGTRFEFAIDGHWNGVGHEEAAKAILASNTFQHANLR